MVGTILSQNSCGSAGQFAYRQEELRYGDGQRDFGVIVSVACPQPDDDPITRLQLELAGMNFRGRALFPVFNQQTIRRALDLLDASGDVVSLSQIVGPPGPALELARDLYCMLVASGEEK